MSWRELNFKKLEKILKGAANHWRLKIMFLLAEEPGLSLADVAQKLNGHFKTISEHTKKLSEGGLLEKRYLGRVVFHSLSDQGTKLLSYIKKFL